MHNAPGFSTGTHALTARPQDLHTFGFPWRPWQEQKAIADGHLIQSYIKQSAAIYGIDKKIKYRHRIDRANFSTSSKEWEFDVTVDGKEHTVLRSKFFLIGTGYYDYNTPLQAVIPGIEDFKGTVVHPQFWPEDLDYTGKDIVIIGSGATAITLLPSLTEKAKHVTILQRSPSYVLSNPSNDKLEVLIRALTWWNKPLQFKLIRWKWVLTAFLLSRLCYAFPNAARRVLRKVTSKQLPPNVPHDPHFNPKYNPWEQRLCLCPDGDFYAALRSGKGSIETGVIESVTPNSIKLVSGKELNPDIIITATGLKLCFGGGIQVAVDGKRIDFSEKYIWQGAMIEDVPNAAYSFGYVDASWTLGADATAQLATRILNQMKKEGVAEVVPRRSPQEKATLQETSLMKLTSTYVEKGKDILPKAATTGPWQPRSYYYKDIWTAWFGDIKSGMAWIRSV